jgi:hypothetical protein
MSGTFRILVIGVAAAMGAALVSGQERPIDPGSLDAEAPGLNLSFGEEPSRRLIINGFGVAAYDQNFDTGENSFADSALAISFSKVINDQFSAFAQVTVARERPSSFLGETGNFGDVETDIDNLQLTWVPSPQAGLAATFGKFDSPLALERDDAPLNTQATSSFTFDFARPVKFTGLQLHETFSGRFEGWAIVGNGWDSDTDNNKAKTGALYALWSPAARYHFGLGVIQGGEKEGRNGDGRTTAVATILMQMGESWLYGEEFVGGREPHAAEDGGAAKWFADMFYLHHRFGRHWAGTVRAEYLDDVGGSRTGKRQILRSVTLCPQYLVGGGFYGLYRTLDRTSLRIPEVALRLDLRWNRSSERVFRTRREGEGRRDGYSATFQTVFLF